MTTGLFILICYTVSGVIGDLAARKRRNVMLYFIKQNIIHTHPVAKGCKALYEREQLRYTVPRSVQECPYCMNVWPGRKDEG